MGRGMSDDPRWIHDSDGEFELRPWWARWAFNAIAIAVVAIAVWGLVDGCVSLLKLTSFAQ
jgi:hypothetical protein